MKKTLHNKNKKMPYGKKKVVQNKVAKKVTLYNKFVKVRAKAKIKVKHKATVKTKVVVKPKVTKPVSSLSKPLKAGKKTITKSMPTMAIPRAQAISGPVNVTPYQSKKNEEYMSQKQLEHFRKVLLEWKSQLMAEVDRTMHHMQNGVANYPDPVDRASQEEEFSLELRARDRERKLLRKIEETLNRINDNDYGYCDDCGTEIGIRRLEARPTATQCIECKTIAEIKEKQIGEGI